MKIVVAQFYTENVTYGKFAEAINKKYCEEKGYLYYCEKDTVKITTALKDRAATWYKPILIREVLETYNPDYVLFLDIDAVVSDSNQLIESFIDENYNLIFTEDVGHHSVVNAGVFILKNTEWSKNFLQVWYFSAEKFKGNDSRDLSITEDSLEKVGYFKNALWHDQTCLTILYESKQDLKDNLKIISNRFLNHNEYNQGNFIFHAYAFGFISNRTLDIIYKNKVEARPKFDSINLIVYHVYCVNNYLEIVEKQLDRLKTSGLYDWCDKIELTCVNTEGIFEDIETLIKDLTKVNLNKFVSNNYEYEGIKKVWEYSQKYEGKVLYFHSKGVSNQYKNTKSQEKSEWKTKGVSWWKEAMEYFLIDSYKDCLQVLDNYDQCGLTINNGWWWGNFWWSNLSWIYSNPEPNNGDRWYFEAWLNRYRSPSYYEYYHFDFNPYYTILPNDLYYNNVKYKDANIELIEAFYGTLGEQQDEGRPLAERNVIDVTEQLKSNLEIHNFKGFHIRVDNNIAGDPCYGTEKALEVRFLLNGERCVIVTDENRNLNFSI